MVRFIAKRLAAGVLLIAAISVVSFMLLMAGSRDIGRQRLGLQATPEQVAAFNKELGIDRPILTQYGAWLGHAVHGDLGESWFGGSTVRDKVMQRLPVTLTIVGGSLFVAVVVAVALGIAAATMGRRVDRVAQLVGLVGFAIPGFLVAEILVLVFAVKFQIFRATGYTRFSDSPSAWLRSVALPIISLSFASLASLALQIRGSILDVLDRDFVRTLRSRGIGGRRLVLKHVLRNASGPALSIVGVQFIGLLGGAVIVEQIFAIPGLGQVAAQAGAQGDAPAVMGVVLTTAVLVILVNLVVDLLTAWLNPKVRLT